MNDKGMSDRLAQLESLNDQLVAELRYLDQLARAVGFENGLETLKEAALEILDGQDPPTRSSL